MSYVMFKEYEGRDPVEVAADSPSDTMFRAALEDAGCEAGLLEEHTDRMSDTLLAFIRANKLVF